MTLPVPVEAAQHNLQSLLERLRLGEAVTLVGPSGQPLALLVSLTPAPSPDESWADWDARWDALARRVGQAWASDQGAVQTLSEMRR